MNAKDLYGEGEHLFTHRTNLMLLWQEIAEHFYPERADFTYLRSLGNEFASNMMTSYPMLCRRDLGDQIGQMLRPSDKEYARIVPLDLRRQDNDAQRWLEWAGRTQRRAMYDRRSQFVDSQKMSDNDFACFGACIDQVRMARSNDRLLFMNWHPRDVAWKQNESREISGIWRKCNVTARDLVAIFKEKVHEDVRKCLTGNPPKPFEEFECYHMEVEADLYDKDSGNMDWWSIWYDCKHHTVMEEVAIPEPTYCIGRWVKPGTSQYPMSPACILALPESRLLQAMTYTIIEVGEKIANPPLIAIDQAVRSDINVYAGGITWADRDYDNPSDVLRPMNVDSKGLPLGLELLQDSRAMIHQAFYLNKLTLPQRSNDMTAYEVGQRVQEYIRNALPLFEPMEEERNGAIWEKTFNLMRRMGAFGSPLDMPKTLRGADLQFQFESPLRDAIDQIKGQKFIEAGQYLAAAVQLDPAAAALVDAKAALRDVLAGVKVPATWVRNEAAVHRIEAQAVQQEQAQQALATMQQGSEVISNLATAGKEQASMAMAA